MGQFMCGSGTGNVIRTPTPHRHHLEVVDRVPASYNTSHRCRAIAEISCRCLLILFSSPCHHLQCSTPRSGRRIAERRPSYARAACSALLPILQRSHVASRRLVANNPWKGATSRRPHDKKATPCSRIDLYSALPAKMQRIFWTASCQQSCSVLGQTQSIQHF